MQKSETINELAKALVKVQSEVTHVPMNATNPFLRNRYADLGSVIETVRPLLTKNGLAFTQLVEEGNPETGIAITTVLIHESGQYIQSTVTFPVSDEKGISPVQGAGKVITYLRRYALAALVGVHADEDTDGNEPTQEQQTQARSGRRTQGGQKRTDAGQKRTHTREDAANTKGNGAQGWDPVNTLVEAKISENPSAAAGLINNHIPAGLMNKRDTVLLIKWGKAYRGHRDEGKEPAEAATLATQDVVIEAAAQKG